MINAQNNGAIIKVNHDHQNQRNYLPHNHCSVHVHKRVQQIERKGKCSMCKKNLKKFDIRQNIQDNQSFSSYNTCRQKLESERHRYQHADYRPSHHHSYSQCKKCCCHKHVLNITDRNTQELNVKISKEMLTKNKSGDGYYFALKCLVDTSDKEKLGAIEIKANKSTMVENESSLNKSQKPKNIETDQLFKLIEKTFGEKADTSNKFLKSKIHSPQHYENDKSQFVDSNEILKMIKLLEKLYNDNVKVKASTANYDCQQIPDHNEWNKLAKSVTSEYSESSSKNLTLAYDFRQQDDFRQTIKDNANIQTTFKNIPDYEDDQHLNQPPPEIFQNISTQQLNLQNITNSSPLIISDISHSGDNKILGHTKIQENNSTNQQNVTSLITAKAVTPDNLTISKQNCVTVNENISNEIAKTHNNRLQILVEAIDTNNVIVKSDQRTSIITEDADNLRLSVDACSISKLHKIDAQSLTSNAVSTKQLSLKLTKSFHNARKTIKAWRKKWKLL